MFRRVSQKVLLAGFVASMFALALAPLVSASGTATLSFTPSSGTYNTGDTLSVGIYEDSGSDSVDSATINLNVPGLLTYKSFSDSSGYGVEGNCNSGGCPVTNGLLKILRGANPAVSGKQLIITLYFTVGQGGGTANLTFDNSSRLEMGIAGSTNTQQEALTFQNASFTVPAPATPPASTPPASTPPASTPPASSGSTSSTPKSSGSSKSIAAPATSTPAAAPSMLSISSITTDNVGADTATIKWITNLAASSEVDYGPDNHYGLSVVDNQLTTSHSLPLSSKDLRASLVYHFAVKSVDAGGNVALSPDMTFHTAADGSLSFGNINVAQIKSDVGAALAVVALIAVAAVGASIIIRHLHRSVPSMSMSFAGGVINGKKVGPEPIILNPKTPGEVVKPGAEPDKEAPAEVIKPQPPKPAEAKVEPAKSSGKPAPSTVIKPQAPPVPKPLKPDKTPGTVIKPDPPKPASDPSPKPPAPSGKSTT